MKRITSEKSPKSIGSYSVGTLVNNIIFTSGQLPINPITNKIESNNIKEQTKQAMINIKELLEDNNSNLNNIIKTTVYLKNIEDFKEFNKVYSDFFDHEYPSRTAFQVGNLPMNSLIEIEAIAKINEE